MKTTIVIDSGRGTVRVSTVAKIGEGEDPRSMIDAILRDVMGKKHRL
jgi:hypothetical protein